jgi:N-acylneuraminate cytidylyltransferase
MSANGLFEGRVKAVKIPKERSIDIDSEMDFRIAEMMLNNEY